MSNKNVCITTEHNNFLTVISEEDALLCQTAENLLKDAISDLQQSTSSRAPTELFGEND